MSKIKIKNRWTGDTIFEYEKENNTVKDTVVEAVRQGKSLCDADLFLANLRNADLCGADLRRAYLYYADLRDADLCGANLRGTNLRGADLSYADIGNADLCAANLRGAKGIPYIPLACPSDGAFIGWKKVSGKLVKLLIPEDARRCSATTQKCRCDKARVLAITDTGGENPIDEVINTSLGVDLLYRVGEMVFPDSFDEDRWNECSHGIHFFVNKQDAINY